MKYLDNKEFENNNLNSQNKSTNTFLDNLFEETSKGLTENMAETYIRSGSNLLDFFAQGGAMRKNPQMALDLFKKAFSEVRWLLKIKHLNK